MPAFALRATVGRPATTVTCFPDARFSTRSFATGRSGTASTGAGRFFEQRQSSCGHPQTGHIRPRSLESRRGRTITASR